MGSYEECCEHCSDQAIDEIRITPGTEVAVYEKGTLRERSNDKAKRILILGVGALNGFELNSFRAVLAHGMVTSQTVTLLEVTLPYV